MITLSDYWMGRDKTYPLAMSPQLERNALTTIELANKLITLANGAGKKVCESPNTGSIVSSGWRPPAVNAATKGAAPGSRHITGQAVDLYDPTGALAAWAISNQGVLKDLGLWMEHPSHTPTWLHVQTVPPQSGNRVFFP